MSSLLRTLGLGRLWYRIWHWPRAKIRQSLREGGPVAQLRRRSGEQDMAQAAKQLPSIDHQPDASLAPIHFLTGARFWYQTAFCLHSYAHFAGTVPQVHVHDDGTLDHEPITQLKRLLPSIHVHTRAEAYDRLQDKLPQSQFPVLHERWNAYPNIRKLIDPYLLGEEQALVLDSDMLFQAKPSAMLIWQASPDSILVMRDVASNYGFPMDSMAELAGARIPQEVNVGITGLSGEVIDWPSLERWSTELIAAHGHSYYLEQGLVAMLCAGHKTTMLDGADYRLEAETRVQDGNAVMRHYVDLAKSAYFTQQWRRHLDQVRQ